MIPNDTHLEIGSLVFDGMDQIALTGPFEVLSRIPNSTYRLYGKTARAVRDIKGLQLQPDADLAEAPAQKVTTLRRVQPVAAVGEPESPTVGAGLIGERPELVEFCSPAVLGLSPYLSRECPESGGMRTQAI